MSICYSPGTPHRHTNPKRTFQRLLFLLLFSFSSVTVVAQQDPASDAGALMQQRGERIAQSLDTRAIDMRLYALGVRPPAVIHTETLENGALRVTLPLYLSVSEEKKQLVVDRLTNAYPWLSSMDIQPAAQTLLFILTPGAPVSATDDIVLHFGYTGHEEH